MNENLFRIEIADQQSRAFDQQRLIAMVENILCDHGIEECEFSIAIVDDPTMRSYNKRWLDHDYETDVLSFLLDDQPERNYLSGQLIVSLDTAARVADELGVGIEDELMLYVAHGTLHLMGLDDTTPPAAEKMREAEKYYLDQMGIAHVGRDEVTE